MAFNQMMEDILSEANRRSLNRILKVTAADDENGLLD